MSKWALTEVKKALVSSGFELYRARGNEVSVADRVRDNLIMESGVSVVCDESTLAVRMVVRAQRSDFPGDSVPALFERARSLASAAEQRGFREVSTLTRTVQDPVDPSRTLDTWYEVAFEKTATELAAAMTEVRFALGMEKTARTEAPAT